MLPPLDLSCLEASAPLARPRAHAVGVESGGQALVDALGGSGAAGPSGKASDGPAASSFALPAVANVSLLWPSFFFTMCGGGLAEIFEVKRERERKREKERKKESKRND